MTRLGDSESTRFCFRAESHMKRERENIAERVLTGRDARARERNPNTNVSPTLKVTAQYCMFVLPIPPGRQGRGGKSVYMEFTCGDCPFSSNEQRRTGLPTMKQEVEQSGSVCQLVLTVEIQGPTWHVRLISVMGHKISVGRKHTFAKREEHTTLPTQHRAYNGRAESHSWNTAADKERGPPPADAQSTETQSTFWRYSRSRYHEPHSTTGGVYATGDLLTRIFASTTSTGTTDTSVDSNISKISLAVRRRCKARERTQRIPNSYKLAIKPPPQMPLLHWITLHRRFWQ